MWHTFRLARAKGIQICGKCFVDVSRKAKIDIKGNLLFNADIHNKKFWRSGEIGRLSLKNSSSLVVESDYSFASGCKLAVYPDATLTIKGGGFVNLNTTIYCRDSITIGKEVLISQNVVIRDSDVHQIKGIINHKPITIGDHVWIGTNAVILKGVSIGEGAVIGAGSVVTNNIPPHCVAAGNPAKVIRTDIEWS